MFDATRILGGLLQGRHSGGSGGGLGGMVQQALGGLGGGSGGTGGIGALLSQFTGKPGSVGRPGGGSGFFDQVGELTRRAVDAPGAELRGNNPAAVGGLGALAGALMGGGKGAVGGGLLAVLGSLAYAAYQKDGASGAAAAAPLAAYTDPAEVQRKARLVLRAMIQATKADGHLDDAERERLAGHAADSGDDAEARAFMEAEMAKPLDVAGLAAEVRSPQEAAEVYAASAMAITVDTDAERDYLRRLVAALNLPDTVAANVRSSLREAGR